MVPSHSILLQSRFILGLFATVTIISPLASSLQTYYPHQSKLRSLVIAPTSTVIHRRKNRALVTTTSSSIAAGLLKPTWTTSKQADNDHNMTSSRTTMATSVPPFVTSIVKVIGSTTSILVAGTFYAFICYRRDALMVNFFMGAISNGILSKVLKRILDVKRPSELDISTMDIAPSDNGMPSSHAMSLGFICTFTAFQVPWTALPLLFYTLVSLSYRVQTKLHSLDQILVGAVVGSLNGAIWWSLCLGNNPYGINFNDWVTSHALNAQGLLPWPMLSIPAIVGALVVGSVERRLAKFFKKSGPAVDDTAVDGKND